LALTLMESRQPPRSHRRHPGACHRDPIYPRTPERAERWIPGMKPGMTAMLVAPVPSETEG